METSFRTPKCRKSEVITFLGGETHLPHRCISLSFFGSLDALSTLDSVSLREIVANVNFAKFGMTGQDLSSFDNIWQHLPS